MLDSKCSQCGCTGIHACMGKPLSDGVIYSTYGNTEVRKLAAKEIQEIQELLEKTVDTQPNNLVS